ncbi:MAG: 1,4-alpha-glucan branching protein domain-containing protein [bacterium]
MEPRALFCLVLHAHLPFVRHPEQSGCLEERWLFEAINECYLPLLQVFDTLVRENVDFRLTLSLSPTLMAMLDDLLLQERFIRYLDKLIELAEKEVKRNRLNRELLPLSAMYYEKFLTNKTLFQEVYRQNLLQAFGRFQKLGVLQIITSTATHGFLPLLKMNPVSVRVQIEVAMEYYQTFFGSPPSGIWLPECGYYPGLDEVLRSYGLRFFFLDTHGLHFAHPQPRYSVYAPVYCPSGVAAFGRDQKSARQVWSSQEGYPGDPDYREFYRDVGHDLDYEYIRPYLHQDLRVDIGIKYYRITGSSTGHKDFYHPGKALAKAREHAWDFFRSHENHGLSVVRKMDRPPLFIAPYDAELFGHWWYEGPDWLNFLMRECAAHKGSLRMITPSEYLEEYPVNQVALPAASSWGWKGYNEIWLSGDNKWIYAPLYKAAQSMEFLAARFAGVNGEVRRALNQACRELLLAQGSDWAFIIHNKTTVQYATRRTISHLERFNRICQQVMSGTIDLDWLQSIESMDNLFPDMKFETYRTAD